MTSLGAIPARHGSDHRMVEPLIVDGGPALAVACNRLSVCRRLAAADLAGEASRAERAPDEGADVLIDAEGHQPPPPGAYCERGAVPLARELQRWMSPSLEGGVARPDRHAS